MRSTLENSKYPVFEANQVLSNRHLNQVFNYLDEQERLTRANLIGIGIVCGLDVSIGGTATAPTVRISKGCGVTSQGYLIVEPEPVELVSYRSYPLYTPPADVAYPVFEAAKLWEIFPQGEPDTTLFNATFLDDKVVLLFLELKKDPLRNCSPVNCDDRGAEVVVTLRRLLVRKDDVKIKWLIDGTLDINNTTLTVDDLEKDMLAELGLPDLRLPRYNVPAGLLSSSNAVLAGFFSVFHESQLVTQTKTALTETYKAFKPLVEDIYPADPFSNFSTLYGFLDTAPQNPTQVRFLQYYYDLFDDLIKAYDEFRWKGAELMCACCPSEALFPRHLLLGLVHPESDTGAAAYRHHFRASSAISGCEALTEELRLLFRRLVEMTQRFSNDPPLLTLKMPGNLASSIRITPSKLGDVPVSDKCIPYYYLHNGTPKLFELWNAEKTRRKRAHHNLSYRYFEYDVGTPDFVANPLRYDLEPHNFLRIEGHLGRHYITALNTLLALRDQYRLPIDVIALRTGVFDENMPVDLTQEECRFRDLETLYDTTREQWLSRLCKELTALYYVETTAEPPTSPNPNRVFFTSKYAFINKYAPGFKVDPHKIGGRYENDLSPTGSSSKLLIKAPAGQPNYDPLFYALFDAILELADALPQDLTAFKYATFDTRYRTFQNAAAVLEQERESDVAGIDNIVNNSALLTWEETDDRLEDLLYHCRPDAFKAINDEYVRRIREVKQKQFLSNFLLKHPGIQHKAGVPVGGTFILVYHDDPEIVKPLPNTGFLTEASLVDDFAVGISDQFIANDVNYAAKAGQEPVITPAIEEAFIKIQLDENLSKDPNIRTIIGAFSGQIVDPAVNFNLLINKDANAVINQYVNGLVDGTVIADFFLPYLCCSDCAGVQYVLPQVQPTFSFSVRCTNSNDQAEVDILPIGGTPPYSYKEVGKTYSALLGPVVLNKGEHTLIICDANGVESAPQTFEIAGKIVLGDIGYECSADYKTYTATFIISGGTAPYTTNRGSIDSANKFTSLSIMTGKGDSIVITDSKGCTAKKDLFHTCLIPLDFVLTAKCTGANNIADVTVAVTGGTAPYLYSTDKDSTFNALPASNTIPLQAGNRTVVIKDSDSAGNQKSKSILIRDQLQAVPVYECNGNFTAYRAKITISGGETPYSINGASPITGNVYTTPWISNGQKSVVKITDKPAGCPLSLTLVHSCIVKVEEEDKKTPAPVVTEKKTEITPAPENARTESRSEPEKTKTPQAVAATPAPCDKPCGGISRECSYRLWIQPPPGKYDIYRPGEVSFTFTDEKGKTQNVPGLSVAVLPELLNKDFHGAMGALIKQLNDKVEKAIGAGRVVLSYEPTDGEPFARLRVEYFLCESFNLKFKYDFAQGGGQVKEYEVSYLKAGETNAALFTNLQAADQEPLRIPAFDCSVRDQCQDAPAEKVCKDPLPRINFRATPNGDQLRLLGLSNAIIGQSAIVCWIWEVDRAAGPFYVGQDVSVQVPKLDAGTTVKLTAITKNGCFVSTQQKINLPK